METGTTIGDETPTREPRRARAMLSTEDFGLLREAVVHYLRTSDVEAGPLSIKYSNLYHRLGRLQ